MKLVYLILVHEQPQHFIRLVKALNNVNSSFYIHLDSKKNESEFNDFKELDNITFLHNSISVNRSGFSQTIAMERLIREASKKQFNYYIFLSGRDYPIKNNEYIKEYFKKNYDMNFINFYPLVGNADWIENIIKYDFIDALEWVPIYFRKPANVLRQLIRKILPKRKFITNMIPYRGSTSWSLNQNTIEYIINFLNSPESNSFKKYFKYVHNSDEIFFQTIVLNSPFANQCKYYKRDIIDLSCPMKNENKASLHYIDWNSDRENPAVFDEEDFEHLKKSDKLFARKFDEVKSEKLLNRIDNELLK
jgi:hypothetical protein